MKDIKNWLISLLLLMCLFLMGNVSYQRAKRKSEVAEIANQLALSSKTLEVQKNLYEKAALDSQNLRSLLDDKQKDIDSLVVQLDRTKQQLVSVTQLVLYWKGQYEAIASASQTTTGDASASCKDECSKIRTRVDFDHDFGLIRVKGDTLTNPPEAHLAVGPGSQPLKVTVALARKRDGKWVAYGSSSDDHIGIDVGISGIDTSAFDKKWYENIGLQGSIFAGSSGIGSSLGATYRFGQFEVGPDVVLSSYGSPAIGLAGIWHPFER